MKRCERYVGITCVNGCCPVALAEEYAERGMDVIRDCADCFYYEGCEDCAWFGTEDCENSRSASGNMETPGGEKDVPRPDWQRRFMERFERVR